MPQSDDERREAGMRVRREVLGDVHVDRAIARTDAFTEPFQDYITRTAWGDIWDRPGLDRRSRSMITLAILTAIRAEGEIAMHVRAAIRNGVTREEIAEVLLHATLYAGVPAGNAAFAHRSGDPPRERGSRGIRAAVGPCSSWRAPVPPAWKPSRSPGEPAAGDPGTGRRPDTGGAWRSCSSRSPALARPAANRCRCRRRGGSSSRFGTSRPWRVTERRRPRPQGSDPFAPVAGTMWAASPARKRRPNCIGSTTKLRMSAMFFSMTGPPCSSHPSSANRMRSCSQMRSSGQFSISSVGSTWM